MANGRTKGGVPLLAGNGGIGVGALVEVMFGTDKDGHVKYQGKVEHS